jgi:aldehyde dehydrogenase (NAD+)
MSPSERANIIYKFAKLIDANSEWLSYYETLNNGKPLKMSKYIDIGLGSVHNYTDILLVPAIKLRVVL